MAGLKRNIRGRQGEQHLVPRINFTCHGFITKWIIGAECDNRVRHDFYPELQTWNSTDGATYTKQGATTFSVDGGSREMTFYEYTPDTPHEFHKGDVLGIFIPHRTNFQIFFEEVDFGPLSYFLKIGVAQTEITIVWNNVRNAARAPLITVEICELEH